MASDICLVIIFNHRYENNIPKLFQYYGKRFENIRIIIPFLRTNPDDRIIRVYENSWNFEGYIVQAYKELKSSNFRHYVFIGDDCILNTRITQDNIASLLELDDKSSFITDIEPLASTSLYWGNFSDEKIGFQTPGVEFLRELPDANTALEIIKKHSLFTSRPDKDFINYQTTYKIFKFVIYIYKGILYRFFNKKNKVTLKHFPKYTKVLPFPLLKGNSDFFIVSSEAFDDFVHYCGIFSSMRMFAEIAIPTALALTSQNLVVLNPNKFQVKAFWSDFRKPAIDKLKAETQGNINELFLDERQNILWYHPIKLSSWEVK